MLGSDFVDVMSQVEWGRICCEPLLNYSNLLHENSVETLHKLGQLMQNYSACPANAVTYNRYYNDVYILVTLLVEDLQRLVKDEFELNMINGLNGVKMGIAYFESALAAIKEQ